jgi:hypothetical protein
MALRRVLVVLEVEVEVAERRERRLGQEIHHQRHQAKEIMEVLRQALLAAEVEVLEPLEIVLLLRELR